MNIARVVVSLLVLGVGAVLAWHHVRAPRPLPAASRLVSWERPDKAGLGDWRAERDMREWLERAMDDAGLPWEARSGAYRLVFSSTGGAAELGGIVDRWNAMVAKDRDEAAARRRVAEDAAAQAKAGQERQQAALARFTRLLDEQAVACSTPASAQALAGSAGGAALPSSRPEPRSGVGAWASAHRKAPDLSIGLRAGDQYDDALLFDCLAVLEGNLGADLQDLRVAVLERIKDLERSAGSGIEGGTSRVLQDVREGGARDIELWREAARMIDSLLAAREAAPLPSPSAEAVSVLELKIAEEPVAEPARSLRGRDLAPLLWAAALVLVLNLLWELCLPPRREDPVA